MSISDPVYLERLNPQQREAVMAPLGPTLVLAGPGSGKTRVLTHRLVYLIHELQIPQWNILAVTFTNKAATEMKSRVQEQMYGLVGQAGVRAGMYGSTMAMGTFHATCARILRIEHAYTPYDRDWVIFDSQDQAQVIKTLLDETGEDGLTPYELKRAVSLFKNDGILPEQTDLLEASASHPHVPKLYKMYQDRLQASNGMDFDDLLMYTRLLLQEHAEVRTKYQRKWGHILVDEFQDTNHVQYDLLRLLTKYEDSQEDIFVVGDEDQSIYAFRGADYENVNRFRRDFEDCRTVLLEQNYRSTPQVLAVANGVIAHNRDRVPKKLFTHRPAGPPPVVLEAYDAWHEAEWISRSVSSLLQQSAYGREDVAVLYRTNAQSRELEEAFRRAALPYRIVGALRFYDRREIKDALAYLRLVMNPRDHISLMRIVNRPARGIGRVTWDRLVACSAQWNTYVSEALHLIADGPEGADPETRRRYRLYPPDLPGRSLKALQRFSSLLQGWTAALHRAEGDGDPHVLLERILEESGYFAMLDNSKEDETDRKENLHELIAIAAQFTAAAAEPAAAAQSPTARFLEHVGLHASQDDLEKEEDKVTLMTLHIAKGLEYPVVYIAGLDEEMLPHSRSIHSESSQAIKAMEEERRTFYVGVTRAQDLLFLTHPGQRNLWGQLRYCEASRFLDEIPEGVCRQDHFPDWFSPTDHYRTVRRTPVSTASTLRPQTRRSTFDWSTPDSSRDAIQPAAAPQFKPAMKVVHPTFGHGVVIDAVIKDGMEEVSIIFAEHGPKRLLAALANLEIASGA